MRSLAKNTAGLRDHARAGKQQFPENGDLKLQHLCIECTDNKVTITPKSSYNSNQLRKTIKFYSVVLTNQFHYCGRVQKELGRSSTLHLGVDVR